VSLALDKLAQYRRFGEITPTGILADRSLSLSQLLTPEGGDGRESAVSCSRGRDIGQDRNGKEQELDTGAMEAIQVELVQTYTELNKCQQICQEQSKEMSAMRKENEALKSQLWLSEGRVRRTPACPRSIDLVQRRVAAACCSKA
jgi:hypothetical protein